MAINIMYTNCKLSKKTSKRVKFHIKYKSNHVMLCFMRYRYSWEIKIEFFLHFFPVGFANFKFGLCVVCFSFWKLQCTHVQVRNTNCSMYFFLFFFSWFKFWKFKFIYVSFLFFILTKFKAHFQTLFWYVELKTDIYFKHKQKKNKTTITNSLINLKNSH